MMHGETKIKFTSNGLGYTIPSIITFTDLTVP